MVLACRMAGLFCTCFTSHECPWEAAKGTKFRVTERGASESQEGRLIQCHGGSALRVAQRHGMWGVGARAGSKKAEEASEQDETSSSPCAVVLCPDGMESPGSLPTLSPEAVL